MGGTGDTEFEEVFDRMFSRAMRVAYRVLGSPSAAEDVAAEALARTYARWSRVRDLPHLDAWVLRVAGNLAIDEVRRKRVRAEPPAPIDPSDAITLRVSLGATLRKLPRRQRDVIVLRYLSGLSENETATALGISLGTVRTHTTRALRSLRERLGVDLNEGDPLASRA